MAKFSNLNKNNNSNWSQIIAFSGFLTFKFRLVLCPNHQHSTREKIERSRNVSSFNLHVFFGSQIWLNHLVDGSQLVLHHNFLFFIFKIEKNHTRPVWVLGPRLIFPGYKARYKQVLTNSWVFKSGLDLGFLILKIKHFGFRSS